METFLLVFILAVFFVIASFLLKNKVRKLGGVNSEELDVSTFKEAKIFNLLGAILLVLSLLLFEVGPISYDFFIKMLKLVSLCSIVLFILMNNVGKKYKKVSDK